LSSGSRRHERFALRAELASVLGFRNPDAVEDLGDRVAGDRGRLPVRAANWRAFSLTWATVAPSRL
jgi:hypothetical protein